MDDKWSLCFYTDFILKYAKNFDKGIGDATSKKWNYFPKEEVIHEELQEYFKGTNYHPCKNAHDIEDSIDQENFISFLEKPGIFFAFTVYEYFRNSIAHCNYKSNNGYFIFRALDKDSNLEMYCCIKEKDFLELTKQLTEGFPPYKKPFGDDRLRFFWNKLVVKHADAYGKKFPVPNNWKNILDEYFPNNWVCYDEKDSCHTQCKIKKEELSKLKLTDNVLFFYKEEPNVPELAEVFKYFRNFVVHYYSCVLPSYAKNFVCFDLRDEKGYIMVFCHIHESDIEPFVRDITSGYSLDKN